MLFFCPVPFVFLHFFTYLCKGFPEMEVQAKANALTPATSYFLISLQ